MKITKYFLSMAAALGMLAGCYKPEMVQISAPEDVVAPVLEDVEGPIEITAANMANGEVAFAWTPAEYGVNTQVDYSLEVAAAAAQRNAVPAVQKAAADHAVRAAFQFHRDRGVHHLCDVRALRHRVQGHGNAPGAPHQLYGFAGHVPLDDHRSVHLEGNRLGHHHLPGGPDQCGHPAV